MRTNSKRVVEYHNNLNAIQLGNFNSLELDIFMTLCEKLRPREVMTISGVSVITTIPETTFTFKELREMLNMPSSTYSKGKLIAKLMDTNKCIMSTVCETRHEGIIDQFVLFPKFSIDTNKGLLTVSVNEEFAYVLTDFAGRFTAFELEEFLNIRGKAAKILYQHIKQFKNTGVYLISNLDDFRNHFNLSKDYRERNITDQIIAPAIEELKPLIPGLKYETIKTGKEHKTTGYRITWMPGVISGTKGA